MLINIRSMASQQSRNFAAFACRLKTSAMSTCLFSVMALITFVAAPPAAGQQTPRATMPPTMVYLKDIDATIAQDIRYAGAHNFLGRPVAGYEAAHCILRRSVAEALARIQHRLSQRGLGLKVYDCYRPARAVRDFIRWARDKHDTKRKAEFYPTLRKGDLFKRRFISMKSKHTLGNTVDLTLIPLGSATPPFDQTAPQLACHGPANTRGRDNSLEFGTGYDCFHARSGRGLEPGHELAWRNRALLTRAMASEGFKNYFREWWHFKLPGAGAGAAMDFPVRGKGAGAIGGQVQ